MLLSLDFTAYFEDDLGASLLTVVVAFINLVDRTVEVVGERLLAEVIREGGITLTFVRVALMVDPVCYLVWFEARDLRIGVGSDPTLEADSLGFLTKGSAINRLISPCT